MSLLCGELIHFGLGEFEPLETMQSVDKPLSYCYDIKFNLGIDLLPLSMTIHESKPQQLEFLHTLQADLSPEKLRLNLDWKSLLGSYKLAQSEVNFLKSVYSTDLIPTIVKRAHLLEPLFLDKQYSFMDSLCPVQIPESELNPNKIIVSALNHQSTWNSQEMTPVKLPLKRHSIAVMTNLIFPSPKKRKEQFEKQEIISDGPLSDSMEMALCRNSKYASADDIVTSLQRKLITAPYSPFEHWKFVLPNMAQPHQISLVESLNLSFLIFSDREHLLSWNHPIFNNLNISMDLMPFEDMKLKEQTIHQKYICTPDNDSIEMLSNKINQFFNTPQDLIKIPICSQPEPTTNYKTLKVGISALMNSVFGSTADKVVEIKQKTIPKGVEPQEVTEMKFMKSSATIVINPTLLQDKALIKLVQSTCGDFVEMGGQMELAKFMPSLIVDENVAIVLVNGFLFTQTNEKCENIGQMQLQSILQRNIQKFQRIYIFSLQYTMMGLEVIPSPVTNTILININVSLPLHCTLQMTFSPRKLGQQLISIFDRQSMIMNRIKFYPLDARMALLVNLPSLNYIHACCVQSKFNSLFEFIESDDKDFKTSNYKDARAFMRNGISK